MEIEVMLVREFIHMLFTPPYRTLTKIGLRKNNISIFLHLSFYENILFL